MPTRAKDLSTFERACRAYQRRCEREGTLCQQPSTTLSSDDGERVVLRNVHGVLASYRITQSDRLARTLT